MTDHTAAAQATKQDPISEAISILTADAASIRESHTPLCDRDDWNSEPETKAYYDRLLRVAGELSKLRAPVADERAEWRAFRDWAWKKEGPAVGQMEGQAAVWAGWQERARRAALSAQPGAQKEQSDA